MEYTSRLPRLNFRCNGLFSVGNSALCRFRSEMLRDHSINDAILAHISTLDLISFARTCVEGTEAVRSYNIRAYDIDRFLRRFLINPSAFRQLQRETGTLISGSAALQFMDRTHYPEADLDIYVHPGHAVAVGRWLTTSEGYSFLPTEGQSLDVFEIDIPSRPWQPSAPSENVQVDAIATTTYRARSIDAVFSFERVAWTGSVTRVQIISTKHSPLQCILSFHSTCVMNFITSDTAFSLYPMATFGCREALSFAGLSQSDREAVSKYARRGWSFVSHRFPLNADDSSKWFHTGRRRRPTDRYTWRIPLADSGPAEPTPLRLSPTQQLTWDPVVPNSWQLKRSLDQDGDRHIMTYFVVKPIACRYVYLVSDFTRLRLGQDLLEEQGELELCKVADLPDDQSKVLAWKWWDNTIPDIFASPPRSGSIP